MGTRKRIKVNIAEVSAHIDSRRKAYTMAIQNIMANGVSYKDAKEQLRKDLSFRTFTRQMSNI